MEVHPTSIDIALADNPIHANSPQNCTNLSARISMRAYVFKLEVTEGELLPFVRRSVRKGFASKTSP